MAVSGAMLAGLGFNPFYAAGICLIANTSPVAYGGLGTPIITLNVATDIEAKNGVIHVIDAVLGLLDVQNGVPDSVGNAGI